MNEMSFDMRRIGQTIARLRRERNLTQLALADQMNVSCQAVSNWERGQSMPDVSKLPELAELLGTSIDALLGRSVPLIEHAAANELTEYLEAFPVTAEEAAEAAPLLPPVQMEELADALPELTASPSLTALLPFLSTEKVDGLLRERAAAGDRIDNLLPFASNALIETLGREAEEAGDHERLRLTLPFLSGRTLEEIASARLSSGCSVTDVAPFLCTETLDRIVLELLRRGQSVTSLLPFVSQRLIDRLAGLADKG